MLRRLLTLALALAFAWSLPALAQADTCPSGGTDGPSDGQITPVAPDTPGGTPPTPSPPPPAPPAPPAPPPSPAPTPTPQPPCDCPALCTSHRTFRITLVERVVGRIARARVQVRVGTDRNGPRRAAERTRGGRLRAPVNFAGFDVRRGQFVGVRIEYRLRGKHYRPGTWDVAWRFYRLCRDKQPPINFPYRV